MSIIFDEADELFPQSPGGVRWHLNLWAKDVIKDLRRRRMSLFMACHGYQDIDGRFKPKIQYKIWMRGSVTMPESLVRRQAPLLLEPGVYYIERTGWGKASFSKIPEKSIILTYTDGRDERDDFGNDYVAQADGGDGGSKGGGGGDHPSTNSSPVKNFPTNGKGMSMHITEECLVRDESGNIISIDLTKLPKDPSLYLENPAITVKKKKSRKQPQFTRKSYLKERTTVNDNKVEVAKNYDEKVEKGVIEETHVPPRERNDYTTDEIDK